MIWVVSVYGEMVRDGVWESRANMYVIILMILGRTNESKETKIVQIRVCTRYSMHWQIKRQKVFSPQEGYHVPWLSEAPEIRLTYALRYPAHIHIDRSNYVQ